MPVKALIFDFFGVVYRGERERPLDQELLNWIAELKINYKTALLSNVNGLYRYADRQLLERYFDVLAPSDELGYAKPQPEAYLAVAQQLDCQPAEALFIDDIDSYVAAAEALGMAGIVFTDLTSLKSSMTGLLNQS